MFFRKTKGKVIKEYVIRISSIVVWSSFQTIFSSDSDIITQNQEYLNLLLLLHGKYLLNCCYLLNVLNGKFNFINELRKYLLLLLEVEDKSHEIFIDLVRND